jgi:hypothetical protein
MGTSPWQRKIHTAAALAFSEILKLMRCVSSGEIIKHKIGRVAETGQGQNHF